MDPVTVGLVTNFLAAGLTKGAAGSRRILEDTLRKNEFSTTIDSVETEFNRSLQSAIEEVDEENETVELGGVEESWDETVVQLYGLDDDTELEEEPSSERLVFDNEEDAVEKIARAIADADGCDLDENPQLERDLKRAVSEAYRKAVDSFGDRLVEAGLVQEFVVETNIEEIEELDRLQDRIEELEQRFTQPKFYDLFSGDEDGRRRASKRIEPQALEFVSRPELEERDECDRLLLLGPGGSGKSRALAELVETYDQDVQHVIVPRAPLQSPQDLQPLRNESFEGDVLLVWDDIHSISPETGNTVFRKAIDELEDILSPDRDLYVLAAARSNHVESLPGDVQKTGSPLWSAFETIELAEFGEEAIEALFDRVLAKEEVEVFEEVREAFLQKALDTDPSPLYIMSVVETAEGERLTMDDIETLPENALTIWEDQYADIKAANDKRRFVLWAVKLLSEVRVPYYHHSLLKGIYAHVLDRDKLTFGPPVEELCQRQWLVPTDEEKEVTTYTVHDVKVEAINESIKDQLWSFSTFLFKEVERYLPSSESRTEHGLHENFGILLREYSIRRGNQLVSKHYEQALDLDPNCATANINYANFLIEELDAPEESKYHYERAIDIDPNNYKIHRTYAYFLKEELADLKGAEDHYERAIEINPDFAGARCDYANLLIEKLDAPEEAKHHYERALDIDPDDIDVHNNYAKLLNEELAAPEEAKHHYEQALTTDPNHPQTHHNYADLLRTEFDMPEETNHHYERALDIDPDNARIHFCYAIHLNNDFNALEKAKHHYERALALNPDFAQAHVNYSILMHNEFDESEEAKRHCERALAIDPDLPQAHHNYANFLRNELDAPENVRKHLEESVRCWHDVGNTENALHALYTLIQICRDVDDENTAIEYCKRAIDIIDDADLDYELDLLWFESVHAVFSETNPRTLYEYSLANILENDLKLATELCEMVWTKRDEHSTESDIYQLALSAGIALAASTQLHDDLDVSHTCDEILNTIDPAQLPTPSVAVYNLLDTGTTSTTPDDLRARPTKEDEEMTVDALEPRAFADLLERLENE